MLVEIGEVVRAAPRAGATADEIAAWYLLKARLLEHVAGETTGSEATAVRTWAMKARERAASLTTSSRDSARTARRAAGSGPAS
ncbi:hypothetical protein K1T35_48000 (plasmid) [Pseudonocardia sp. DSM 110487]|uniref:hypothetical protein n=1 Tax=Pseudonocardia sp. DSM 110487 TaxID=2865833 RepID=UPI001C69F1C7|nr:hypothetical protein [Pseudonocardia sp. DSM 110487]QYN41095.1 hypothetical protein K1T35_48000 [Pseudonocardia sp. DSM 110487]